MLDPVSSLIMIAVVAVSTFATRAASFIAFPKGREIPSTVKYIGAVLPPAVIGMLVVYCLRSTEVLAYPYGIPELISCLEEERHPQRRRGHRALHGAHPGGVRAMLAVWETLGVGDHSSLTLSMSL